LLFVVCQNYLREQPDNIKSFNIVGETAQFVNLVYSNINSQNIDLCIQLFETLNEFTVVRVAALHSCKLNAKYMQKIFSYLCPTIVCLSD